MDLPGGDPVGPGPGVEVADRKVVVGDHQRTPTSGDVAVPGGVEGVEHRFPVAAADPTVAVVGVYDTHAAVAQPEGGRAFPHVGEPAHIEEFGCIAAVFDKQGERAPGCDR